MAAASASRPVLDGGCGSLRLASLASQDRIQTYPRRQAQQARISTKLKLFSGTANPVRLHAPPLPSSGLLHDLAASRNYRVKCGDRKDEHAVQALSHEVAAHLGLQLGAVRIKRFADGEIYVQVQESIRGCDVFLLQPTCPTHVASVNDSLMELMVMVDACRCALL